MRRLVKTSSHTSPNMFVGRMLMLSIPRDEGWWRGIKCSNVWEDSSQVDIETHRNSTWSRPCCYNLGTRIPAGLPCKNQLNRLTDFGLFFLWFPNLKNQCKNATPSWILTPPRSVLRKPRPLDVLDVDICVDAWVVPQISWYADMTLLIRNKCCLRLSESGGYHISKWTF